jgi:hypothetical protein
MENRAHTTHHRHVDISVHELLPHERLRLGLGEHTILVEEGILYVVVEGDELALIPGDEVVVRGEDLRGAWNAGTDLLRVSELSSR